MVKKPRKSDPVRSDWRPKNLGIELHDLALTIAPEFTKEGFSNSLKRYLEERGFLQVLDKKLIEKLYRHTYNCLQLVGAVEKMHVVIQSKDWQRREAAFGFLRKKINSFERELGIYRNVKLPLTDMLVRSVTDRIVAFNDSLKYDLRFYARMTANEKKVVSGYLKPKVESQYIFDIYNLLAKRLKSLKEEEFLLIVAGCIDAGKILPSARDEEDLHNLIDRRIRRVRKAYKRESTKFEWGLADDFSPFFLPYDR